jgi:hypothetical protein
MSTGTHTLFCQIGTPPDGRSIVERRFSVAPNFQSGGNLNDFSQVPPVGQLTFQEQLLQLNVDSDGSPRDLWAVSGCSSINTRTFGFMLQCLPTARMLAADRGALGTSLCLEFIIFAEYRRT